MTWGIGDPRWCPRCQLIVKGKYLADDDGQHLVCPRCSGEVDAEETPELTTDRAQRRVGFGRVGTPSGEILYEDSKRVVSTDEGREILEAVVAVRTTQADADARRAEFLDVSRRYVEASTRLSAADAAATTARHALKTLAKGEPA